MMTQTNLTEILGRPIPTIQIMDVGAAALSQDRYHQLVTLGHANVTGFEPDPTEYAKLQNRKGPYRYLPVFLGNGAPGRFHFARFPGCSSLLPPDPSVIDMFMTIGCADPGGNFHVVRTEMVDTVRLDDLGTGITIDYLKIDVQGYELEILRNGRKKLSNAVVIESEVEFVPLYRNQPLFGDLQCFMREEGFVLHKFIDVGGRPFRPFNPPNPFYPISQLLWADAIFIRDFTRLDSYSDDGLLKAAAVLDLVYDSYDIAALLLNEYDRRMQTNLCRRYCEALNSRKLSIRFLNVLDRPN
jgi:FkbM family methyltransferase